MIRGYLKTILLLLILIFSISSVSAIDEIDLETVELEGEINTKSINEIDEIESNNEAKAIVNASGNFAALNTAIGSAGDNGVVNLIGNVECELMEVLGGYSGGIHINKNITINGNGFTIKAVDAPISINSQIFNIGNNGNLILKNIILQGGLADISGGAIYNNGGTITIANSTITQNKATMSGGAIYNTNGGNITIKDSTFTNNNAANGGAIFNDAGTITIIESTITESSATSQGGAIFNSNILTITNSIFTQNSVQSSNSANGGTIYNNAGSVTINNSTFRQNNVQSSSSSKGGVIYSFKGTFNIFNSAFTENNAYGASIIEGGVIYNREANINIINSVFENNVAQNAVNSHGGVICNELGNLNVSYSIFYNNSANGGKDAFITSGNVDLSTNFWGTNNPEFSQLIYGSKILDDFITINLILDAPNEILNLDEDLPYHIEIALNDTSKTLNLDKLGDIFVTLKNNDNNLESFSAKNKTEPFTNNVTITFPNNYSLFYKNSELNSISYILGYGYNFRWLNFTMFLNNYNMDLKGKIVKYNSSTDENFTNGILIDEKVNIFNGTIDGSNAAILFNITDTGEFSLENITLQNGTNNKGIIYNNGNLNIINAILNSNTTSHLIYNNANSFLFLNNNIMDNNLNIEKIYNNGTITSKINLIIMNEDTITADFGNSVILNATLTDDKNNIIVGQNITLTNLNLDDIVLSDYINGLYNITYLPPSVGIFNINGTYQGGNNLTIKMGLLKVIGSTNLNITVDSNIIYSEDGYIHFNITTTDNKKINGTITVNINGTIKNLNIENGYGKLNINDMPAGENYLINATFTPSDNQNYTISTNNTEQFTINKATTNINITSDINITYKEDGYIYFNITTNNNKNINGTITVNINGTIKTADIINGQGQINLNNMSAGKNYLINATFTPTDNQNYTISINDTYYFTIAKSDELNISLGDTNIAASENQTISITVNPNATGNLTITINGTNITSEIINGTATFNISDYGSGNYTLNITYSGDDNFNGFNSLANITINKSDVDLVSDDIIMFYKNGTKYWATLTDYLGNPIEGQLIQITVNGVTYNRTTDVNGTVYLNINLNPNTYNITANYGGSRKYNNASITTSLFVNSTLIVSDLEKYYRNGSQYEAQLLYGNGTPIVGKNITFNINGVFYNRTTNAQGIATLNINLSPGEYVITAEYEGLRQSSLVLVKPTLTANDVNKTFGTNDTYDMTLVDGAGQAIANTNITININGVFYNRTTDGNGIARLNINLNPGSYIATATYNESTTSNIITVRA
ncbi:beta strand repeat-containing protein [Methanobrevibacter sp. DSM 116169]|uniref:beta strand repeat-containing protein n=1 Tax=Methanobrevibacter sp. DSM 116169 TaxID=3242727 RepID=UPI0038FCCF30